MNENQKTRLRYLGAIILIIIVGLLSRKLSFVPLFVGDILYAVMIVGWLRFFFLSLSLRNLLLFSLLICFGIEFSQLLQMDWLVELRGTLPGRLVLGRGFLWSDLLAYTVGVLGAGAVMRLLEKR